MLNEFLSGLARAYDDVGFFLIAVFVGPPLVIIAITVRHESSMRRLVRRLEEMFPGAPVIAGETAEVTDDDRVGKVVKLRSGWLQTMAVVVLPDRLEVWGKGVESAYIVLDRRRLQVRRQGIWVRQLGDDDVCGGLWLTDGEISVVIVPYARFARGARRALARALNDLGEDPKDHLDAI